MNAPTKAFLSRALLVTVCVAPGCSGPAAGETTSPPNGTTSDAGADAMASAHDATSPVARDASGLPPDGRDGGVDEAGDHDSGRDAGLDAGSPLDVCAGGAVGVPSSGSPPGTMVRGYGFVRLEVPADVLIVGLTTTLAVPAKPPASGTVFLWPGLQPAPSGANFTPIDNGVLQPVLTTWGPTCAPSSPAASYASWWVSAQYVNTNGTYAGYTGCQGGTGMNVGVGDSLTMTMALTGTTWSQRVTDDRTAQSMS